MQAGESYRIEDPGVGRKLVLLYVARLVRP